MRAANGGGIAAVGTATTGTHTRYNNAFFMGAWDGLLHGADHRVGAGQTAGKVCLYTNYYVGEPDRAQIWAVWNSLMGDPATDMWIGVPQSLTVTAPAALALGAGTLDVTVQSGAAPVPGPPAGLRPRRRRRAGARHHRCPGQGHAGGRAVRDRLPAVDGERPRLPSACGRRHRGPAAHVLRPVVHADHRQRHAGQFAGNGNGQANPGETLALVPTLRNTGTNTAFGVSSTLVGRRALGHRDEPVRSRTATSARRSPSQRRRRRWSRWRPTFPTARSWPWTWWRPTAR
jgi:hypothetical protein